jgi:CheY-like chemotaxis protein
MPNTMKVLIADDNAAIVDVLTMILEEESYEVLTASGSETLAKIHATLPNLIFLDIWMPGMNGPEICQNLKGHEQTKHIPIIMLSANKDTARIANEVGADDFLAKPFDMEEVLALVKKHTQPLEG